MIEEYIGVARAVLAGDAGYAGQVFRTGMVPLDSLPVRADLPGRTGAAHARAGRIADGVILNLMSPAQAGEAVATVRSAAKAAGRDPSAVEIACVVHCCCLSDDADAAAAATRAVVPRYVLHPAAPRPFSQDAGVDLGPARALALAGAPRGQRGRSRSPSPMPSSPAVTPPRSPRGRVPGGRR